MKPTSSLHHFKRDKARQHWVKIRQAVCGTSSSSLGVERVAMIDPLRCFESEQGKPIVLSHGMQSLACVKIQQRSGTSLIKAVLKSSDSDDYLVLFDNGNLCILRSHGLGSQETYECRHNVIAVAYAQKPRAYITVCMDNKLRILDTALRVINEIPYAGSISGILYNEFSNEILTFGLGCASVWAFRTAYTVLIPRRIVKDGISPTDLVTCASIERTTSEDQRLFLAILNSVHVFCLRTGLRLHELLACHNADITGVLHYQPLKLLVTSGKDGSIKTWDAKWSLNCLFVGHTGPVTGIAVFPFGPFIMSVSKDRTLKTWSLDSRDETDSQQLPEPVLGVCSNYEQEDFFCHTEHSLHLWKVKNLHSPFVILGSRVKILKSTTHPMIAPVSYCICDDACVRLICPVSGEVITTMIVSDWTGVRDAVYMITRDLLFVLLSNGDILKSSTTTNPCTLLERWTGESLAATGTPMCLSIYEYIGEAPEGMNLGKAGKAAREVPVLESNERGKTDKILLLAGCVDGTFVVIEWENSKRYGKVKFSIQVRCSHPVFSEIRKLISQGHGVLHKVAF